MNMNEMGGSKEAKLFKTFVGKTERKIPLGSNTRRWDDNIKVGLKKIGSEAVN
jgi:hypothetical protein